MTVILLAVWSHLSANPTPLQAVPARRFATKAAMVAQIAAWAATRNAAKAGTRWQFTAADARVKLKALCPIPDTDR